MRYTWARDRERQMIPLSAAVAAAIVVLTCIRKRASNFKIEIYTYYHKYVQQYHLARRYNNREVVSSSHLLVLCVYNSAVYNNIICVVRMTHTCSFAAFLEM